MSEIVTFGQRNIAWLTRGPKCPSKGPMKFDIQRIKMTQSLIAGKLADGDLIRLQPGGRGLMV